MSFVVDENTLVVSDSHFGHKYVLVREPSRLIAAKACGFRDFFEFHRQLWNECVGKNDFVLHLGDLYYPGGFKYLKNLNGVKKLIIGNNDVDRFSKLKDLKHWSVNKGLKFELENKANILDSLYKKYGKSRVKNDIFLNAWVLDFGGERIMFSHFPVFHRKKNDRFYQTRDILDDAFALADCTLNIHGHIHSKDSGNSFCFNVCCEQIGFRPRKLGDILKLWRHRSLI